MYTAFVKRTFSIALAAFTAAASAQNGMPPFRQPKIPTPPPINAGVPWKKTAASAMEIAKAADAKLGGLRNASGAFMIHYWIGDKFGEAFGDEKIRNNKTFVLQYLAMHYSKDRNDIPGAKADMRANGKFASIIGNKIKVMQRPLAYFRVDDSQNPADWATGVSRYALAGMHGEKSLTHLIQMASRPGSGFTVASVERAFPFQNRTIKQRQIIVERTKTAAARQGPLRIAITVDSTFGLPVTARVDAREKGKVPLVAIWTVGWHTKKATFPDSDFKSSGN